MQFQNISLENGDLIVRTCIHSPSTGSPIGDILYIHGFGDRCDNHGPLFSQFVLKGFRVIAFDLPSHGENSGTHNHINQFPFSRLAAVTRIVESTTRQTASRPLILSGFSTGGLLATRIVQSFGGIGDRSIFGLILFSPGIYPQTLIGENGIITVRTLTSNPNPPYQCPPKPDSPYKFPQFNEFIGWESREAVKHPMPNIRTLVFTAGRDMYIKSVEPRKWVRD